MRPPRTLTTTQVHTHPRALSKRQICDRLIVLEHAQECCVAIHLALAVLCRVQQQLAYFWTVLWVQCGKGHMCKQQKCSSLAAQREKQSLHVLAAGLSRLSDHHIHATHTLITMASAFSPLSSALKAVYPVNASTLEVTHTPARMSFCASKKEGVAS